MTIRHRRERSRSVPDRILGVDAGGTFTDFVLLDSRARDPGVAKRLSTPDDPARAVVEGIQSIDPAARARVAHGTTVATNTLLERTGARTALVTTAGFGDLLALGRGARAQLYNLMPTEPPPLVPAGLCFEAAERVTAEGTVLVPLTDAESRRVALRVAASGAQSVAVCFLFSYLYPDHEARMSAALREACGPSVHVSSSVAVLPEFREYERASTVAVNAYVAPRMAAYLTRLQAAAAPRSVSVMASHAGTLPAAEAARLPVATVLSGPAAGVCGAVALAGRAGHARILTLDMGGTSTDVALCDGEVPMAAFCSVGGFPVHRPTVDVHTVGAGGGSIVFVDAGGALRVGPASAGSSPGPACYGLGGRLPTVTDAQVVLGRLPADQPLAGGLRLDSAAARAALAPLARELGGSIEAVALGALAVVEAVMARALRRVSVERGFAAEAFTLVAFGGAGPLHVCALAELVGARRALVPAAPGALSAVGLATAVPRAMAARTILRAAGRGLPVPDLEAVYRELSAQARAGLEDAGGAWPTVETRRADLRYAGQSWELSVPWPGGAVRRAGFAAGDRAVAMDADRAVTMTGDRAVARPGDRAVPKDADRAITMAALREAFDEAHRRRFGYARAGEPTEIVALRVEVALDCPGVLPPPPPLGRRESGHAELVTPDGRAVRAPVEARFGRVPGETIAGPAILTQMDATTFVAPSWTAQVGVWGDLELRRVAD